MIEYRLIIIYNMIEKPQIKQVIPPEAKVAFLCTYFRARYLLTVEEAAKKVELPQRCAMFLMKKINIADKNRLE